MAQGLLDELATSLRVVIVNGPRQSGKTTMLRQYQAAHGGSYRTLDNRQDQEAAIADPVAFANYGQRPRGIDPLPHGTDAVRIAGRPGGVP
jgi:predicted AAA+ superfamily ATPase